MAAGAVLGLLTCTLLLSTGLTQTCLPKGKNGPPLPTFPDQFSTEIEANIVHSNLTLRVTDYYDNVNNRGRIDSYSAYGVNTTLVDYNKLEVSHIMTSADGSKSCFAAPLAADSSQFARRRFGTQFNNGTAHVVTTSQFLRFGEEFNETYLGIYMVRGIPCHRWQSCNVSDDGNISYTIDYYFTQSNWSYYPDMLPVQVIVNGTRPDNTSNPSSPIYQVYNVYSFINFQPGPSDDDLFRVPPGLPCQGKKSDKKIPPLPDDYYSVVYETIDQQNKVIKYYKEYYFYSQQLYRLDTNFGFPNASILIEDFNEGVQYFINNRYGSCSISPINATYGIAVATYPNGTMYLQRLRELYIRENDSSYVYEGVSRVRDVDTESWILLIDRRAFDNRTIFSDGYIQAYYTHPSWSIITSLNSYSNISVPWHYVVSGTYNYQLDNGTWMTYNSTNEYHELEFQTVEPDFDVFDVSVCFDLNQYSHFNVTLPLPAGTSLVAIDHTLLKSKIRAALSQAVNVPASRIGSLYVHQRTNDSIIVFMHVLDTPPYSIHQNTMTRDQIVSQLMGKVKSGQVTITLGGITIKPTITMQNDTFCNATGDDGDDDDDGLGTGVVVGLSIALFLVGLLVGIGLSFLFQWLLKSKGKYGVSSYNKHQDELVNN